MPTGILGKADLVAASNTAVYTVPSSKIATLTLSICNLGNNSTLLRVALADSSTPTQNTFIEYDTSLSAFQVYERTGIVMDASKVLVVRSSNASVTAVAYGFEEAA